MSVHVCLLVGKRLPSTCVIDALAFGVGSGSGGALLGIYISGISSQVRFKVGMFGTAALPLSMVGLLHKT